MIYFFYMFKIMFMKQNNKKIIELGKNIKKYRIAKSWTQKEFAEKLNCSRDYICKIENGKQIPSLRNFFRIADILEVKEKDLLIFQLDI